MLPTPISPGSNPFVSSVQDASSRPGPDLRAVNELLGTMKSTLCCLGATFDTLGAQTVKIAGLEPAIDAIHQIHSVRLQLDDQRTRQEERMQDAHKFIKEELENTQHDVYVRRVDILVQDMVKEVIQERVRAQLKVEIAESLRERVSEYKRRLMVSKIKLHNSEARRHNAAIRSTALDEQLHPLRRPFPISSNGAEDLPTPSPLFPPNVASLLRLGMDELERLIEEYETDMSNSVFPGETTHVQRNSIEHKLNTFMAYIGVGCQLVPQPPAQGDHSNSRRPLVVMISSPYTN